MLKFLCISPLLTNSSAQMARISWKICVRFTEILWQERTLPLDNGNFRCEENIMNVVIISFQRLNWCLLLIYATLLRVASDSFKNSCCLVESFGNIKWVLPGDIKSYHYTDVKLYPRSIRITLWIPVSFILVNLQPKKFS